MTTVDINPELQPDIVDDIINPQQLSPRSYDLITCFEVLEHMPFEQSRQAVQNLAQIARKYLLISIPDMRYFVSLKFSIFGTLPFSVGRLLSTPRLRRKRNTFGKDHYWEIGIHSHGRRYSAKYVKKELFADLHVVEDFRCFPVPWHHYYVIRISQ